MVVDDVVEQWDVDTSSSKICHDKNAGLFGAKFSRIDFTGRTVLKRKDKICFLHCYVQWRSEIRPFQIWTLWRPDFKRWGFRCGPNHSKIWHFCLDFKWFWQIGAVYLDFKWLSFQILDSIGILEHLLTNPIIVLANCFIQNNYPNYSWELGYHKS